MSNVLTLPRLSPTLHAFPWITSNPLFPLAPLPRSSPQNLLVALSRYESCILNGNDSISCNLRFLLQLDDSPSSSIHSNPTSADYVRLASLFCAYRTLNLVNPSLFDDITYITPPPPSSNSPPPQVFYKKLLNWVSVTRSFCKNMSKFSTGLPNPCSTPPPEDPLSHQFLTLNTLLNAIDVHRVFINVQMAVTYLTYITHHDFSNDGCMPDWNEDLIADDGSPLRKLWSQCSSQGFRLPLHLATLVSPILLLCNFKIFQHTWDRKYLIQYAMMLARQKPVILYRVEMLIWDTLFQLCRAEIGLTDGLSLLANQLDRVLSEEGGVEWSADIVAWFSTGASLQTDTSPSASTTDLPSSVHSLHEGGQAPGTLPNSPHVTPSASSHPASGSADRPPSPHPSDVDGPTFQPHDDHAASEVDSPQPSATKPKKLHSKKKMVSLMESVSRMKPVKVWTRFGDNAPPTCPHPAVIANQRCDDSNTQIFRLDCPYFDPKSLNLDVVSQPKDIQLTLLINYLDGASREVQMYFHDENSKSLIDRWKTTLQRRHTPYPTQNMVPCLRVTNYISSSVDVLPYSEVFNHDLLTSTLRRKHILFTGVPCSTGLPSFDKSSLNKLVPLNTVVDIIDYSQPDNGNRLRNGSLLQLFRCSLPENHKILSTSNLPREGDRDDDGSFMSDRVAWSATRGSVMCPQDAMYPSTHMRWSDVSLKGALRTSLVHRNGCGSYIGVNAGVKLVFLAYPKNSSAWIQRESDPVPESLSWDYEAVVLTKGTKLVLRPNTVYVDLTIDHTIGYGGYYYSTDFIADTFTSFVHSFMSDNHTHQGCDSASRSLLQRFVIFFYNAFVLRLYDEDDPVWDHLPDLTTNHGCSNFITLCFLGITMAVLDRMAYQHMDVLTYGNESDKRKRVAEFAYSKLSLLERDCYVYTRGMAYHLLDWLLYTHTVVDLTSAHPNSPVTRHDLLADIGQLLAACVIHLRQVVHRHPSRRDLNDVPPEYMHYVMDRFVLKTFSLEGCPNEIGIAYKSALNEEVNNGFGDFLDRWVSIPNCNPGDQQHSQSESFSPKDYKDLYMMGWSDLDTAYNNGVATAWDMFVLDDDDVDPPRPKKRTRRSE